MDLRLKTAGQLSPEEQRFLADHKPKGAIWRCDCRFMVEAEKAKGYVGRLFLDSQKRQSRY